MTLKALGQVIEWTMVTLKSESLKEEWNQRASSQTYKEPASYSKSS